MPSRVIERATRLYRRAYESWRIAKQRLVPTERQRLFGLTIAIGGVCGLAAVAFHIAIERASAISVERAMAAAGHAWIGWTLAVPAAGGLAAGLLLQYLVPNARGSGIPQVKVAYAIQGGRLRLRDSLGKFAIALDDLTVLAGEPELPSALITAADVMQPPVALREHDTVRTAYDRMMSSGLRELPVIDAGRRVVGLVNEVAIARAYLRARHAPVHAAPER